MRDLPVTPRLTIPGSELEVRFARSGGAGGQHVNKVETKVEVRWRPATSRALSDAQRARILEKLTRDGELLVTAERTRDQSRNREEALRKLAALVRGALARPKPRKPTRPSRGAVERRLATKKRVGRKKRERGKVED